MHLCTDSTIRKALRIGLAATAVPHLRQNDVVSAPSRRCQNSLLASIEGIVFLFFKFTPLEQSRIEEKTGRHFRLPVSLEARPLVPRSVSLTILSR